MIDNFLKERGMSLSLAKTAVLPFTRLHMDKFIPAPERQPFMLMKEHKLLGIILDRQLSWASNIRAIQKEVNTVVN